MLRGEQIGRVGWEECFFTRQLTFQELQGGNIRVAPDILILSHTW